MPTSVKCQTELYDLLVARMSLDEVKTVCFRLGIDPDDLATGTKSALVRELIKHMERRDQITLLCDRIVSQRPDDLKADIERLECINYGPLSYLDIAIRDFLPPQGRAEDLRNPEKIYLPLKCSITVAQDEKSENALNYIYSTLPEKPVVLVVGDYGTGKSFLTQKIVLESAGAYRTSKESVSRIPIYFPLKELQGGTGQVLGAITNHLRKHRFFRAGMSQDEEQAELTARLRAGEFLCILDGFDEIPLISVQPNTEADLKALIACLAVGKNRSIITTRPAILPGIFSPAFLKDVPETGVVFLRPWKTEETWHQYVLACIQLGVDFKGKDREFEQWVLAHEELEQLTTTPLYCQMLVETREEILGTTNWNLAKLYESYIQRYFGNVSKRSPLQRLDDFKNDPQAEIRYKKSCLAATSVCMLAKHTLRLTTGQIESALKRGAQQYGDAQLEEFTRIDVLIYSLLVLDAATMLSFSHKSFYEYFVAFKIYQELSAEEDRFATLADKDNLLTNEIVAFLAGLLAFDPPRRDELAALFNRRQPLQDFYRHSLNKTLLRNLALTQLELAGCLVGVDLNGLNLQGYRLSSQQHPRQLFKVELNSCKMEGAILSGAVLRGSQLRTARLDRCILDSADLRGVDLDSASLQDISCEDTRFSGATLRGVSVHQQDANWIRAAISKEKARYPEDFQGREDWFASWFATTEENLRRGIV